MTPALLVFMYGQHTFAEDCRSTQEEAAKLIQARDYKAAVPVLEQVVSACPTQTQALLALAKAQLLSAQYNASLDTADRLLAQQPENVAALVAKAQTQYFLARDSESEATLEHASAIAPNNEQAHYWLGREYYHDSRAEAARDQFLAALKINPKSYKAWENLGLCYAALQQDGQAFQAYLKAIDLVHLDYPKEEWPYVDMAELLLRRGDYKLAFDTAVEAAQRNPASASAAYCAGKALLKLERFELSAKWMERAAKLDPNDPRPHYSLVLLYHKQGKLDLAHREAELVETLQPYSPARRR